MAPQNQNTHISKSFHKFCLMQTHKCALCGRPLFLPCSSMPISTVHFLTHQIHWLDSSRSEKVQNPLDKTTMGALMFLLHPTRSYKSQHLTHKSNILEITTKFYYLKVLFGKIHDSTSQITILDNYYFKKMKNKKLIFN